MRIMILSAAILAITGCGAEVTQATPKCDRLIELGQLENYARQSLHTLDNVDATVSSYAKADFMMAGDTLVETRNSVGGCDVHMAHAKNIPADAAEGALEAIRMILIEVETDTQPATVAAAGQRFLCPNAGSPAWQPEACSEVKND